MKKITNYLFLILTLVGFANLSYSQASTPPCSGGTTNQYSGYYDEQIYNVNFSGDFASVNNTTASGGFNSATGPVDYTSQVVEIYDTSTTMNFSVTIGTSYFHRLEINIDTTGDGEFDTEVYGQSQKFGIVTGSITLPTLSIGLYNIRVSDIGTDDDYDPCTVSGYGEIEDYTLSIIAEPNCLPPTDLSDSAVTQTSATLNWTATTGNISYNYAVYAGTDDSTTAVDSGNTSNTYVDLSGLTESQSYYVTITAVCLEGTASAVNTTFTTRCDVINGAWSNDFEANTDCWLVDNGGDTNTWIIYNNSTAGGGALSYGIKYSSTAHDDYLISPAFTVTSGVSDRMSFDARNFDTDYPETMDIQIWNAEFNTMLETIAAGVSPGTAFETFSYDLSTYVGQDILFVFYIATTNNYYMFVDNIVVDTPPQCESPTAIESSDLTNSAARVSWTANTGNNSYDYAVYAGTDDSTTAVDSGNTSNTYVDLSGLTGDQSYYITITPVCLEGTANAVTTTFITLCDPISAFPYSEDFESITTGQPYCWSIAGTTTYASYNFSSYASGYAGRGMRFDSYYNSEDNTSELISPIFDASSLSSIELKFYYKNPTAGDLDILVSNDGGTTFTGVGNFTSGQSDWVQKIVDLTGYISSSVIVKFKGTSNYGNGDAYIYLDSVQLGEIPPTWTGTTDSDWSTSSNWSPAVVPTTNSDVTIPANSTVTATSAVVVNSVTMASGSSLIASSTFSGNITYNRNLANTDWYLVSSPVMGQDIDTFVSAEGLASGTNNNNMGLASYDNTSAAWSYHQSDASVSGDFALGSGRSIKLAAAGDISFTGTMPVENVSIAITSNTNGYNLVGNPYPSHISINDIINTNTASLTEGTLWIWDNYKGGYYATFNLATPTSYISPAQGFFVKSNGTNSLSITEAMQSHQSDSFLRLSSERPEISLVLSDGEITRDTDVYYIDGTTTGFDNGYDSTTFGGAANNFSIYTHLVANSNGQDLAIQSLPNSDLDTMIIPVGITAAAGEQISISANAINLPEGVNIYLEDKNDNSFTILDSTSTFTTTPDEDLNGIGRFYIHTTATALSDNQVSLTNVSMYVVDSNLTITGVHTANANVRIYDLVGKEVVNTSFEGTGLNKIELPILTTGVYVVQLETQTEAVNKKIIIKK